jgi:hypothetical protein
MVKKLKKLKKKVTKFKSDKAVQALKSNGGCDVEVKDSDSADGDREFNDEAGQVENALKRSFGSVTSEYRRRTKASDGLALVASHWTDGDAKRLVLALAHRYGTTLKVSKHDLKKPMSLLVANPKNSQCNSAKLKDLDWDRGWWTDDSFGMHYLHVYHKDGETIHRVYCRHCQQPRIEHKRGKLYWLFCK